MIFTIKKYIENDIYLFSHIKMIAIAEHIEAFLHEGKKASAGVIVHLTPISLRK